MTGWYWEVRGCADEDDVPELLVAIPEGDDPAGAEEAARSFARASQARDVTVTRVLRGATVPSSFDMAVAFVTAIADGQAGSFGTIIIGPPDVRQQPLQLTAEHGAIRLNGAPGFEPNIWTSDKASEAVSAYCAAVEGGA